MGGQPLGLGKRDGVVRLGNRLAFVAVFLSQVGVQALGAAIRVARLALLERPAYCFSAVSSDGGPLA
jgi:hypothetical protein